MKTKLFVGVITMGIIILAFKANDKMKFVGSSHTSKEEVETKRPIAEVLVQEKSLHDIGVVQEDTFSGLPTVNSIMDQYRTLSESELRAEIVRVSQIAESRDLYEKANSGRITQIERKDLAQIIRINTALHHLLIDRELEEN